MKVYKLKGQVNSAGNLVITEPVKMPPGDVEVIVLQQVETVETAVAGEIQPQPEISERRTKIKAFQDWFEKTQPATPDFDPDEARSEALKKKHNL